MIRALLVLGLAAFFASTPTYAQAPAPRLALIIGNAAYQGASGVATAEADATIVAEPTEVGAAAGIGAGDEYSGARVPDGRALARFASPLEGNKTPESRIREAVLPGFNVTRKSIFESSDETSGAPYQRFPYPSA